MAAAVHEGFLGTRVLLIRRGVVTGRHASVSLEP
jgi:hypothetical protein